jgi:ribosomal protein L37AE/L43A
MNGHSVTCSSCGNRFSVPYEIGLWSCPICRSANESAAVLADRIVASPAAQVRPKPAPMQLADALGRMTRKKPLYAYADKLIDVACPECQADITMTNNVRTVRCVNCEAVVQRT